MQKIDPQGRIVILTGAGISKESGLDTFRDPDGLWQRYSIEEIATPEAFERNPEKVHGFYNARRRQVQDSQIKPNAAHEALARLERDWQGEVLLITQNVDNLHEQAGSRSLIHMHGELLKVRCENCGVVAAWQGDLALDIACLSCAQPGGLRPHVVWFGEMPFEMDRIYDALAGCDLFLSVGTSGNVYPAAQFVAEAARAGAHTVELNLEPSSGASLFAEQHYGPATEVVPHYLNRLVRA